MALRNFRIEETGEFAQLMEETLSDGSHAWSVKVWNESDGQSVILDAITLDAALAIYNAVEQNAV